MSVPTYTGTIDINSFRAEFLNTYEGSISGLWWNEVANLVPIGSLNGVYPGLAAAVGMKAWSGSRQMQKPLPFKLSLVSAPFESSVVYPLDNFNVDGLGIFRNNIADLAVKAAWQYNFSVRDLLKVLHTTESFDSKYDGTTVVDYFSTSHPIKFDLTGANPASTQSNLFTSNATPVGNDLASLAVVDKNNPTAAEMSKIVVDVISRMLTLTDLNGDTINGTMRAVDVFVGDAQKFSALSVALSSINLVAAASGAVATNVLQGLTDIGFKIRPILDPGLSGDSMYFLRADGRTKPLIVQETQGLTVQTLGPDSEYAAQNNQVLFGCKKVFAVGPLLYTSAAKATLITKA